MIIGIIGLPQSGKTTLFNAICGLQKKTGGYSAKGEINRGNVKVPDERLDDLNKMYSPKKVTHAEVEWMDVTFLSGDVEDRSKINAEIPNVIRESKALAHVVNVFENNDSSTNKLTPEQAIAHVEEDLIFSDIFTVEKRLEKISKRLQSIKDDKLKQEAQVLLKCLQHLNEEKPLRELDFLPSEEKLIRGFQFLSAKPKLIILNISEDQIPDQESIKSKYLSMFDTKQTCLEVISARVQMEIGELEEEDRLLFMEELGITDSAFNKILKRSYDLLGLISFLTAGPKEVRAWTIRKGTPANQAAGTIHQDIERGFIRAEIVSFNQLMEAGSEAEAKNRGWTRLEGKDYEVQDGDVVNFRFNV